MLQAGLQGIRDGEKLPPPIKVGQIYIQHVDITLEKAKELIELTATHSAIPEAIVETTSNDVRKD